MYFKELACTAVVVGKSELCRLAHHGGNPEKSQIRSSSLNSVRLQNSFLLEGGRPLFYSELQMIG